MKDTVNLNRYADMGFDENQLVQIQNALENGLSTEQIKYFANPKYNPQQMREIREGFEYGLPIKQVEIFAKPFFSCEQMYSIRTGLVNGLSIEAVEQFAHPDFSWEQMDELREQLERGTFTRTVNLVIKFDDKKVIERFTDSDSAIVRFEEAKHLNGVQSLFMTFSNGSSWSWKNNEMQIQKQHSKLSALIADADKEKKTLLRDGVYSKINNLDLHLNEHAVHDR